MNDKNTGMDSFFDELARAFDWQFLLSLDEQRFEDKPTNIERDFRIYIE